MNQYSIIMALYNHGKQQNTKIKEDKNMTAVLVVGGVSLAIIWGGALYHAFFVNR